MDAQLEDAAAILWVYYIVFEQALGTFVANVVIKMYGTVVNEEG